MTIILITQPIHLTPDVHKNDKNPKKIIYTELWKDIGYYLKVEVRN
ncbi:MAG: hypothetical protein ACMUEM_00045 [Flavobacteriales bacterium AspAUS03]